LVSEDCIAAGPEPEVHYWDDQRIHQTFDFARNNQHSDGTPTVPPSFLGLLVIQAYPSASNFADAHVLQPLSALSSSCE
jgi:hypothetical protein